MADADWAKYRQLRGKALPPVWLHVPVLPAARPTFTCDEADVKPDDWANDPKIENLRITGLPTVIVRRDGKEVARMDGDQCAVPEKTLAALVAMPARR